MSTFTAAWQAALEGEYQAVFGYGLLGPRVPGAQQGLALADQNAHEGMRDAILTAMAAVPVAPAKPAADYPALYPVGTTAEALALAARLEDECATAWRGLYLSCAVDPSAARSIPGASELRHEAQSALTAAAVRAARWRKVAGAVPASRPFPGI